MLGLPDGYIGRRYSGNVPCFEFVRDVLIDLGLVLPAYDYQRDAHLEALRVHLAEHSDRVESPQFGDVVVMRSIDDPVHIGIMTSRNTVAHHTRIHGVIIERTNSLRIRGNIVGYFRPRFHRPL